MLKIIITGVASVIMASVSNYVATTGCGMPMTLLVRPARRRWNPPFVRDSICHTHVVYDAYVHTTQRRPSGGAARAQPADTNH